VVLRSQSSDEKVETNNENLSDAPAEGPCAFAADTSNVAEANCVTDITDFSDDEETVESASPSCSGSSIEEEDSLQLLPDPDGPRVSGFFAVVPKIMDKRLQKELERHTVESQQPLSTQVGFLDPMRSSWDLCAYSHNTLIARSLTDGSGMCAIVGGVCLFTHPLCVRVVELSLSLSGLFLFFGLCWTVSHSPGDFSSSFSTPSASGVLASQRQSSLLSSNEISRTLSP
jgi:hypothetical protein